MWPFGIVIHVWSQRWRPSLLLTFKFIYQPGTVRKTKLPWHGWLTRLAQTFRCLLGKKMLFLLPENINPVSYCLLVSFYRWFAAQYRVIRIADVARPRTALNHRGVISVTNKKSENRHKFTRNVYGFNLRGRSSLAHNPRHLSQCCCWSGANWIMPLPVFVLNLSHDFD